MITIRRITAVHCSESRKHKMIVSNTQSWLAKKPNVLKCFSLNVQPKVYILYKFLILPKCKSED